MFDDFLDNSEYLFEYLQRNIKELIKRKIFLSIAITVPFFVFLLTTDFNPASFIMLLSLITYIIISVIEKKYTIKLINSKIYIGLSLIKPLLLSICLTIVGEAIIISDSRYFVIYQPKMIIFATIMFALCIFLLTPYFYNIRSKKKTELPVDLKIAIFIPVYYTIFLLGFNFVQKNENFSGMNTIVLGICLLIAFLSLRKSMYLSRIYFYVLYHSAPKR